jgi:acyl-CoA synthetase (AMP-forming)/AMP-acid ligase II
VLLIASGQTVSSGRAGISAPDKKWRPGKVDPYCPPGLADMTVPEAFLAQARRSPSMPIVADQTSGVRTNRQLILGVRLLADHVASLPGETVGVMLPASVGATASFLAVQFAGKTPAMINWTLGLANVEHCLDLANIQSVVTARALVDRLARQGVDFGDLAERFVFIEDIRKSLTRREKLKAALASYGPGAFRLPKRPTSETAVVLFTSGSESTPKAVPLSHRNLLSNLDDIYQCFNVTAVDAMLGILPPFHSFGLATSVILSLGLGLRTVYHPDPTDSATVGEMAGAYQATLLAGTPTFLAGVLQATPAEMLTSLRLVVSGAEKCPDRLYETLSRQCPQTTVLEGYGVTECSPVISVNHQDDPMAGTIGPPMASLEWAIVDPDTLARRSHGERGMLLVRGPSVFGGYLNHSGASPFIEMEGKQWYRTGDLVVADADGVLTFSGRLKRFVKIGGEMISLPAVETILSDAFDPGDAEGPVLAVSHAGEEGHAEIVLFSTIALERQAANDAIRAAGLSGLHNVRRVISVDSLPLLGSGKVDHRSLQGTLSNHK